MLTGDISGYHSDDAVDSILLGSYVIESTGRQPSTFGSNVAALLKG